MKIEELIRNANIEHPSPRLLEDWELALKYEATAQKEKVSFLQTFSTSFFPKLITNSKRNERCLLWDNHFWDLFERFYFAVMKIENHEMNDSIAYDFFISLFTIFLSTRFYRKTELSLIFAKRYASTGFFIPPYYSNNNVRMNISLYGHMKYLVYCKDFVFFHEMHHARYQQNQEEKNSDFERILDACHLLQENSSLPHETKDEITKLLNMHDNSLLEEICCDINSICVIAYLHSGGNSYDEKIASEVINSVRLLSLFINSLKKIELVYKKRCDTDDYNDIQDYILGENYAEIEARNYIIYFVSYYLMGFNKVDYNRVFFLEDESFNKYFRPYNDILSIDFITSVFGETKLYSQIFKKEECKVARDIIIGWHKSSQSHE